MLLWLPQTNAADIDYLKADCNDFINERPSRVTCGFFSLPLNHDNSQVTPSGLIDKAPTNNGQIAPKKTAKPQSILIPVMIAGATGRLAENQQSAVLVPGGGGPGSAIGFGYSYEPGEFLQVYDSLRQAGIDVVIVDQRGAGFSNPRLTCAESLVAFTSMIGKPRTVKEELSAFKAAVTECRQRLQKERVAVEHFDTRQSAFDFLAIMNTLDYQHWFTIATSYATTIAQAMQALQPNAFDRIVLDSPVPLHYQHPITWERTRIAINDSIARCASSDNCASRYPELSEKLDQILATATEEPYLVKIRAYDEDGNGSSKTLVTDDTTLLSILGTAVYYNEHISELPQVITRLHDGLVQSLYSFAETFWYQATDDTYADGLNLTIHCKERQALEDAYVAARPGFTNGLSNASKLLLQSQQDFCRLWGVAPQPHVIPRLRTDTKTLILAGGLDPVISVEDIESTAGYFTNVSVETMAGAGHSVWYQHQCARTRVVKFLTHSEDSWSDSTAVDCDDAVPGFK